MAEMKEAKSPERRSYHRLTHTAIEHTYGPNPGHKVMHHYSSSDGSSFKQKEHIFSTGQELADHFQKMFGTKQPSDGYEDGKDGDGDGY